MYIIHLQQTAFTTGRESFALFALNANLFIKAFLGVYPTPVNVLTSEVNAVLLQYLRFMGANDLCSDWLVLPYETNHRA